MIHKRRTILFLGLLAVFSLTFIGCREDKCNNLLEETVFKERLTRFTWGESEFLHAPKGYPIVAVYKYTFMTDGTYRIEAPNSMGQATQVGEGRWVLRNCSNEIWLTSTDPPGTQTARWQVKELTESRLHTIYRGGQLTKGEYLEIVYEPF